MVESTHQQVLGIRQETEGWVHPFASTSHAKGPTSTATSRVRGCSRVRIGGTFKGNRILIDFNSWFNKTLLRETNGSWALIKALFLGGYVRGGWLTIHNTKNQLMVNW